MSTAKEEQFAPLVERLIQEGQRIGQAYFNALQRLDPALAMRIRSTRDDPYYDNKKIKAFLETVYRTWSGE